MRPRRWYFQLKEFYSVYCWSRIHRIAWFYAFSAPVFKNFLKIRNRLPKLNFKYVKRTIYLVLKYLILWHSDQSHMVKFVVLFYPSIDRTKESLLLLPFFQYLDKSNVYEILISGRWRVIQQIGGITVFSSSTVLIRESREHEGISTLPGLIKSSIELETDLFAFSEMKGYFKEKTTQRL